MYKESHLSMSYVHLFIHFYNKLNKVLMIKAVLLTVSQDT